MRPNRLIVALVSSTCIALTACTSGETASEPPLTLSPSEHSGTTTSSEETSSATSSEKSSSATVADAGETCGSFDDGVLVALEDGTTCDIARDVMTMYKDNLGQAQGQALFWTAPNGWDCFGRYRFPGEEDNPSTRKLSCSAEDPSGAAAEEGSGGVALADPGEDFAALLDLD